MNSKFFKRSIPNPHLQHVHLDRPANPLVSRAASLYQRKERNHICH